MARLAQLDSVQVDGPVVHRCCIAEALPRQLHPAVHKGVVLAMPPDDVVRWIGVDGLGGGPRALLSKENDLGGPQVLPPRIVRHLVVTHLLRRVVIGNDARGRRRVLFAHHATKASLVNSLTAIVVRERQLFYVFF